MAWSLLHLLVVAALGLTLEIGLTVGTRVGVEIAHGLARRVLERLFALMLLGVGLVLAARVF